VIVRSRYQATTSLDTAGWIGLSVCCSELERDQHQKYSFKPGSREVVIVRSSYQATTSKTLRAGNDSVCSSELEHN
jgi:hypothetical protein